MGGNGRVLGALSALVGGAIACNPVAETGPLLSPPSVRADAGPGLVDAGPQPADAGPRDATSPPPPPPPDAGPSLGDHGAPCVTDEQCVGGTCLRSDEWPGGYCTLTPCQDHRQCDWAGPSFCVERVPGTRMCAPGCGPLSPPCRSGYTCQDLGPDVCMPEPPPPLDGEDGDPCIRDGDCRGGECLTRLHWPQGYCTTLDCESQGGQCASHRGADNVCVAARNQRSVDAETFCGRVCETLADCRAGYACVPDRDGTRLCLPDDVEVPAITTSVLEALGAQCGLRSAGGRLTIDYTVPSGTTSYMVVAFSRDGRYVVPREIRGPTRTIDFFGDRAFQAVMTSYQGWISPVLVPQTIGTRADLATGLHTFELETRSQDVCWYLAPESTPGTTLDLDVHLVGLSGLDAASAGRSPALQAVLRAVESNLAPTGVRFGQVRYFDARPDTARRLSVLRDYDDFFELMRTSASPGATRIAPLTLNLFFVRSIQFPDGGPIGISSGLPGPAGLHGTGASGVVSTAEFLGVEIRDPQTGERVEGEAFTGLIVAHEIGHYLGLFHTTETDGERHDPIADTPECDADAFPLECPDLGNLMFPLALPRNTSLTPGQAHTVRANPLSKD